MPIFYAAGRMLVWVFYEIYGRKNRRKPNKIPCISNLIIQ